MSADGWSWVGELVDNPLDQQPIPAAHSTPRPPTSHAQSTRHSAARATVSTQRARKSPVVKSRSSSRAPHVINGPDQASTSKGSGPPRPYAVYANASDISYSPKHATKEGQRMVKAVSESMDNLTIENGKRREDWGGELEVLQSQEPMPMTLIAVCGATGAGKSSLLNAILQDNIAPTSGMRACTAVVTKFSYNKKRRINAEVRFLAGEEWRQELEVLLTDLTAEDGSTPTNDSELAKLSLPARVAWDKIHAVYPTIEMGQLKGLTVQQILDLNPAIARKLGRTEELECKTSDEFTERIDKYISSADDWDEGEQRAALWPLIREVHIRCHAQALSSGAVLVDLPGIADANAARNNIAKDYLKHAQRIWIVAPITRAVDDGTAQKLLGDVFKTQLLMDGKYNHQCITFIASKCDDVSCKEIITALRLRKDPALASIESQIVRVEARMKELNRDLAKKRDDIAALEADLRELHTGQRFCSQSPAFKTKKRKKPCKRAGPCKRRRPGDFSPSESDSDSDSSEDSSASASESDFEGPPESAVSLGDGFGSGFRVGEYEVQEGGDPKKARVSSMQRELDEARRVELEIVGKRATCEKDLLDSQRAKNAFCSQARSRHAQVALKEQFRSGLEELHNKATCLESIDLPVFTCSSRDYVRSTGQVKGDGEPVCFTDVRETGIPALQEWCHHLTRPFREEAALRFLWRLTTLASRIRSYVENIDARPDTAENRQHMRNKYETKRRAGDSGIALQLSKHFANQVENCVTDLEQNFKAGIEASCEVGVQKACNGAVKTVESLFKPWQTWKAVLRRRGDWERLNLNQMLLNPFMNEVASSFAATMDSDMFATFKYRLSLTIYEFLKEFESTANAKLKGADRVSGPLQACQKNANRIIEHTISLVKAAVQSGRADTSRSAVPSVKAKLEAAYRNALAETGTGSINRQQTYFSTYVHRHKQDIFESAAAAIHTGLARTVHLVDRILRSETDDLAKKIEVDLAVLWEEVHDTNDESQARMQAKVVMSDVEAQVKLWQEAAQLAVEQPTTRAP